MAAGLGFKTFNTGDVLSAADVNGYLMQGILVFASAAARDAAITSPQEGQFAFLKDTNVTTYYTGSAWANVDTTGMTNPMTTTGDVIYSSSGSTPARLGIGTAGQVLKVNSGATAPEWATPVSGSFTSLASGSITNGLSLTSISGSYTDLYLVINNAAPTVNDQIGIRINNNSTTADYVGIIMRNITGTGASVQQGAWAFVDISGGSSVATASTDNSWIVYFPNYAGTTNWKTAFSSGGHNNNLSTFTSVFNSTLFKSTSAIDRLDFKTAGSDWKNQGTYVLYGVK